MWNQSRPRRIAPRSPRRSRATFNAHLIGLGAEAIDAGFMADPYSGLLMAEWIVAAQEQIVLHLKNAEAAFRRDAAGLDVEWRTVQAFPVRPWFRHRGPPIWSS